MSKITEIIESKVSFLSEEDQKWITEAMKQYAEWYANKCLALATLSAGFVYVEGRPCIVKETITDIDLPNHE